MSGRTVIRRRTRAGGGAGPDRREALGLLAAGSAAALASCSPPRETITPFVDFNGDVASGAPVRYATALELSGYARGVIGVVVDGRPVKVEGARDHPASLGATDPFLEGAVLDLFDPQRAKTPMRGFVPADWRSLETALAARLEAHAADRGAGLALLTGRVLSPTLIAGIDALAKAHPAMRRVRWEPLHDDAVRQGSRLAHGRLLDVSPRLQEADIIVALDADFLGPGPDMIRLARAFAARRRPEAGPMSRLYVLEPTLSPTGVMADRREAARPELIHNAGLALAAALGAPLAAPPLPAGVAGLVKQAAADLAAHPGCCVVLAGPSQAPEIHALAAWMNGRLHAPLDAFAPLDPVAEDHAAGLADLASAMRAGQVSTLVVIDSDPVYGAPPELGFGEAMRRVPFSVHAGRYRGATGLAATWNAPLSHPFESWSDARAFNGAATLVQPLVAPLYDTRTAQALLAAMVGGPQTTDLARLQQTWRAQGGGDFGSWWSDTLAAGLVPHSAATPAPPPAASLPKVAPATFAGLSLVLRPSAQVWDGRFAANAWLQECPEPVTKETWGASLALSPADAQRLGVETGDSVAVRAGKRLVQACVRVATGQADGAASLPIGYGQAALGPVADGVGPRGLALRDAAQSYVIGDVELVRAGGAKPPPPTQHDFRLDPLDLAVFPIVSPADDAAPKPPAAPPDLLAVPERGPIAWAMVVDTAVCIGCNACVVSCQSENNVPVIGADQVSVNRDMHWLRVDRYERPDGVMGFQPVPCMQCEQAPCEPVCPVEASVHDQEGLNDQVYNRCIGTRFCESNCPYKVRRFNFLDYENWPVYGLLDHRSIEAQRNPEVSVRARGVMEKCTYCVQRVAAARRTAEKQDRPIRDGEVTTACQDACPTRAISFGNLSDPPAAVNAARADPRHYVLLEALKTRPRTTFLARAVNPPPEGPGET